MAGATSSSTRADAGVARWLGLRLIAPNAHGARYGFPLGALGRHKDALLAAGRSVVVIVETNTYYTRIKHRVPAYRMEPL